MHLQSMSTMFAVRFMESKGVLHFFHGQNIKQTAPDQANLTSCSACNIVETYRIRTSMLMTSKFVELWITKVVSQGR